MIRLFSLIVGSDSSCFFSKRPFGARFLLKSLTRFSPFAALNSPSATKPPSTGAAEAGAGLSPTGFLLSPAGLGGRGPVLVLGLLSPFGLSPKNIDGLNN